MFHQTNGFRNGNPALRMKDTQRRTIDMAIRSMVIDMNVAKKTGTPIRKNSGIWRDAGCGELYEYLLPEGSRIVQGNIFVRTKDGKLVCLGTRKEVVEKGMLGEM